jgi:hypothetical protein
VIGKEAEEISLSKKNINPSLCATHQTLTRNLKIVPVATPHKNRKIIRLSSIEKLFGPQFIVL